MTTDDDHPRLRPPSPVMERRSLEATVAATPAHLARHGRRLLPPPAVIHDDDEWVLATPPKQGMLVVDRSLLRETGLRVLVRDAGWLASLPEKSRGGGGVYRSGLVGWRDESTRGRLSVVRAGKTHAMCS
jgi:hypothetical protein